MFPIKFRILRSQDSYKVSANSKSMCGSKPTLKNLNTTSSHHVRGTSEISRSVMYLKFIKKIKQKLDTIKVTPTRIQYSDQKHIPKIFIRDDQKILQRKFCKTYSPLLNGSTFTRATFKSECNSSIIPRTARQVIQKHVKLQKIVRIVLRQREKPPNLLMQHYKQAKYTDNLMQTLDTYRMRDKLSGSHQKYIHLICK